MSGHPLQAGDPLPTLEKSVTQEQIEAYARASGDFNPIHLDADFAGTTQYGRRIAHGMLILAFISEMMSTAFPHTWPAAGSLKVRFRAPVFPGEIVSTYGQIDAVKDSGSGPVAECSIGCRKPDGTDAVAGRATVSLPEIDG